MRNKSYLSILVMICLLLAFSAQVIMAEGPGKTQTVQSSSEDCDTSCKLSTKRCTPSPSCCPGASKSSAKAESPVKELQPSAKAEAKVSDAVVKKNKSID